jgi:hypothetical protein
MGFSLFFLYGRGDLVGTATHRAAPIKRGPDSDIGLLQVFPMPTDYSLTNRLSCNLWQRQNAFDQRSAQVHHATRRRARNVGRSRRLRTRLRGGARAPAGCHLLVTPKAPAPESLLYTSIQSRVRILRFRGGGRYDTDVSLRKSAMGLTICIGTDAPKNTRTIDALKSK